MKFLILGKNGQLGREFVSKLTELGEEFIAYSREELDITDFEILRQRIESYNPDIVINCTGDQSGMIIASAVGGLGNYVYVLKDESGNDILPLPTQNIPGVFTELSAGTYQVTVSSGDCFSLSELINIREPSSPLIANYTVTDITCSGGGNGVLDIQASGGTGIIKYAISPQLNQFFETSVFENLIPGLYQAIAQDELGCFVLIDFIINDPIPVTLTIVGDSLFPEVCEGNFDGEFSIEISGGNLPYSLSLDDVNGDFITGTNTQTEFDFYGLGGGNHVVYVRDALGCESEWNITFPESVLIDPQIELDYGCTNNVQSNSVVVTVDASITDLTQLDYALDDGAYQSSNIFENILPGAAHYIDVRHTNGCIQRTEFFNIPDSDPLILVLDESGINEITALISGGAAPYNFALNGDYLGNTNTFTINASGAYVITVTDSSGCTVSASIEMEFVDICIPNYFTPNGDGVLDDWGPGCAQQYPNLTLDIYDRYGRTIARLRQGEKWDGKYDGSELPTGDYWYTIKLNDDTENRDFVGHFTLYR